MTRWSPHPVPALLDVDGGLGAGSTAAKSHVVPVYTSRAAFWMVLRFPGLDGQNKRDSRGRWSFLRDRLRTCCPGREGCNSV